MGHIIISFLSSSDVKTSAKHILLSTPFAIFTFIQGRERERVEEVIFFKKAWSEETLARSRIFMVLLGIVSYRAVEK